MSLDDNSILKSIKCSSQLYVSWKIKHVLHYLLQVMDKDVKKDRAQDNPICILLVTGLQLE